MRPARNRVRLVLICSIALASSEALAKTVRRPDGTPPVAYVDALDVANRFLGAWAMRDGDAGLSLMSEALRKRTDEAWLRDFVVGLSTPQHGAFEIGPGRRRAAARYEFPVILYETANGERQAAGYAGTLGVVREGAAWRVDRLPATSENPHAPGSGSFNF